MLWYIIVSVSSIACGIAACYLISSYSPEEGEEAEGLEPKLWFFSTAALFAVSIGVYAIGISWIAAIIMAAILVFACMYVDDTIKNWVTTIVAIPFAVTMIGILANGKDQGKEVAWWLVFIPVVLLLAIFLAGKFKALPAKKKERIKEKCTIGNILTLLFGIAVVITAIWALKEVL